MAHLKLLLGSIFCATASAVTCPGFPGYCSESFPGQTCNVVCSFGRNNVPLCQDDGTWTDIPRCIEHEPGVDEQIPGMCPAIPGYCSQGFLNQRCQFDCRTGIDINSICTSDGTWQPYPVCEGDLRETRDGCDGCPGPNGNARNRTAEAILISQGLGPKPTTNSRVPKTGSIDAGRKQVPSFAGSIEIGTLPRKQATQQNLDVNRFSIGQDGRIQQRPAPRPAPAAPRPAAPRPAAQPQQAPGFQTNFQQRQQPRQQPQQPRQQPQQPRQQPQQGFQQGLNTFQPNGIASQPLSSNQPAGNSLFNQIKSRINEGNRQRSQQQPAANSIPQPLPAVPRPTPRQPQQPQLNPNQPTFGPFEAVNLGNSLAGSERGRLVPSPQPQLQQRPVQNDNFFGEFATVDLQG